MFFTQHDWFPYLGGSGIHHIAGKGLWLNQGRNYSNFEEQGVGWWYQGTIGAILINSNEVHLRGFAK